MGDSKPPPNQPHRVIARRFILSAALLILITSAWPLAKEWFSAIQPAAPEPQSANEFDGFEVVSHYYYVPLGGLYAEWAYLMLFCVGMVLHGRSLSQARPRIAMAASFVVGLACLYAAARLLIVGAEAMSRLFRSTEWEYFFLLSPASPQGTFGAGIVLAVSALAAAEVARAIIGSGLRFVSSRSTPA